MTLPQCVHERTPLSSPPAVLSKAMIAPHEPAPASRLTPTPSLPLFARHLRELQEGSGIAPNLISERGYGTVSTPQARSLGFSDEQARSGLLIPFYTPSGELSYQLKPDKPRTVRGKVVKYETRAGHDIVLDVHPTNYWRLLHGDEPLDVIEGIKKADCAASHGRLAVGLSGVWNWGKKRRRGGAKYGRPELLPDWEVIPLEGRIVHICFDADYRDKQNVALAMLRLAERLTERGAHVYIMNIPGPEKGLDDYLVAGGDLGSLEEAARPFTPSDLIRYAAKPDKRIWSTVARIGDAMRTDDWRGAATTHSLLRALLELALLGGRYDRNTEAVEVMIGTRELRHYAAIGSPNTLSSHTAKLEERGYTKKVAGERAKGRANRYILKLSKPVPLIERGGEGFINSIAGTPLDNFTPHLRWPAPASTAPGGDERDSKLPDVGATPENFPHEKPDLPSVYRVACEATRGFAEHTELEASLGKVVELALHFLQSWGGKASLRDLSTATGINHTGKLRAKLEEVEGVFGLDAKGKHGARVWFQEGWQRCLDERRERGGELRRGRQQAVRHRQDRDGFRADVVTDEEPPLKGAERVRGILEAAEERDQAASIEEQRRKVGTTPKTFLADAIQDAAGFGWRELRALWEAKGGKAEDLRRAVKGPYRFNREGGKGALYVERRTGDPVTVTGPDREPAPVAVLRESENLTKPHISPAAPISPNLRKPEAESPPGDWRSHPLACKCDECLSPMPMRYARAWSGA
jgi:hypothetical protein